MLETLSQLVAASSVVGASVAFVHGDRIEVAAAGCRDALRDLPVTVDTVFDVASLTKPPTPGMPLNSSAATTDE